jgi:hypothetical protein
MDLEINSVEFGNMAFDVKLHAHVPDTAYVILRNRYSIRIMA